MDELEFVELPPMKPRTHYGPNFAIRARLEALKARPGEWAIVKDKLVHTGAYGKPYRKAGCLVTSRKQPDGTITIYACWPVDG